MKAIKSWIKVISDKFNFFKTAHRSIIFMESIKRKPENSEQETEPPKRLCRSAKTMALLMMYSGKGYFGMQRNHGFATIEEELLKALRNTDLISEDHFAQPGKIRFNRASKTDKNVSACGQVVSLRLPAEENIPEKLNNHLPPQIRIIDAIRTTKGFHCKGLCKNRTYMYVTPTFAFAPKEIPLEDLEQFRLSQDDKNRIDSVLQRYVGTRNYYNFTSGRAPGDRSCIRYMLSLTASEPFIRNGMEFLTITIVGQSFMLHQIRKMVALAMAVAGNFVDDGIFDRVFKTVKLDIPKAPGLGLVLLSVNYDSYNLRYGSDGMHKPIDWTVYKDLIRDFQEKFVLAEIYESEKKEKVTMLWRETLDLHTFSENTNRSLRTTDSPPFNNTNGDAGVEESEVNSAKDTTRRGSPFREDNPVCASSDDVDKNTSAE